LGQSRSVLNVGAGTGSYEPANRFVVAVEPLLSNDPAALPALAILTIHHWSDRDRGLAEMRRVARDRVVIFTWDPEHSGSGWFRDYLCAYWRRPEAYLDARARAAISTFSKVDSAAGIARLRRDLEDGTWSDRYGALQSLPELDIGYRLVVAQCT
jgi:hypothetical protein